MTFLLIVSTTATFFGLFGTVWGLLKSFLSITALQDSSLIVIAPGIADALITTVFGLIAAIPATIFYNIYNTKINNFEDQMINFGTEVLFINNYGWLIKKYTSSQEIQSITISNNLAGIIYKDKIEFLNL